MATKAAESDRISRMAIDVGRPALIALAGELRASRDRAIAWLLDRIADDGEVANSAERNGWARVPWALAIAGETEAAARVLSWIERTGLAADGDFREGPALGNGTFRAYPLAHLAIGAHLVGRHDIALPTMGALRRLQHPVTGGMNLGVGGAEGLQELLFTAQAGLSALVTGQDDIAENANRWIRQLWQDQPGPAQVLYCMRAGSELVTEPDPTLALMAITDFTKPRQLYYTPSIAAVFLAKYGALRGDATALQLARDFLEININGPADHQYDDLSSVQICKFGWGVAAMMIADPISDYLPHLVRMGHWFISRQAADGAWSPSQFLVANPSDVDKMLKTAEHAVEIDVMLSALGTQLGKSQ